MYLKITQSNKRLWPWLKLKEFYPSLKRRLTLLDLYKFYSYPSNSWRTTGHVINFNPNRLYQVKYPLARLSRCSHIIPSKNIWRPIYQYFHGFLTLQSNTQMKPIIVRSLLEEFLYHRNWMTQQKNTFRPYFLTFCTYFF